MKKTPIQWILNSKAKNCSMLCKLGLPVVRTYKSVDAIVIHNTGNTGDTAENNVKYFSKKYGSNTRSAGANYFVDQKGNIGKSIPLKNIAYAVGNPNNAYKRGAYYSMLSNKNTVHIELCDIMSKEPSKEMVEAVKKLIKHIRYYCPNAKTIVRHYDIVRKDCPSRFVSDSKAWNKFRNQIDVWG